MNTLLRGWLFLAFCLTSVSGCVGTIDAVMIIRGSIEINGEESDRSCEVVLYDGRDDSIIAIRNVKPTAEFTVGFDVPSSLRSFVIGARCAQASSEYRSEVFETGENDEVDLGNIELQNRAVK